MGGHPQHVCSRVGGRGRHRARRCHGVAVRTRRHVRAVPDLPQRTLALRTAPRSRRSRLPSHVRRPYARSKDAGSDQPLRLPRPAPPAAPAPAEQEGHRLLRLATLVRFRRYDAGWWARAVALEDHARADVLVSIRSSATSSVTGSRNGMPPPTTTGWRTSQLVDEAELDRRRGQAGTADRHVLVGRVERRSGLLGHGGLGEPGISLNAVERTTEDDLRDRAPDIGERGPGLVLARRRIRLPHLHRLVEPAAEEIPAELAYLLSVKAKQLVAPVTRCSPRRRNVRVCSLPTSFTNRIGTRAPRVPGALTRMVTSLCLRIELISDERVDERSQAVHARRLTTDGRDRSV